jgi:citrate synthase
MAWLTSEQALAALGTKPQSLYASVSRGRIRVRPDPADSRRRLYDGDDIERLAGRPAGRRRSANVAADAIRWGDPVLPSTITSMIDGRLYYRGRDAIALADTASLEDVAALLWQTGSVRFAAPTMRLPRAPSPLARGLIVLAERAATDAPLTGRTAPELQQEMPLLVGTLAVAFGAPLAETPLHRRLAAAWRRPEAAGLLRRALVLLADHELNASTFAARIAASTSAPLAATLLAGLATLTGPRHGGAPAAIASRVALLHRDGAHTLTAERPLPGFGHRLYPAGDPRAAALLDGLALPPAYAAYLAIGSDLTGEAPNVDFALAALAATCDLPPDAPLLLFGLARSVGWLAHALEQHLTGTLFRPRAHYAGPSPAPEPASPSATTEGGSRLAPLAPHHEVE